MAGLKTIITVILSCFLITINVDFHSKPQVECQIKKTKKTCQTTISGFNSYAKEEIINYKDSTVVNKKTAYKDEVGSRISVEKYKYDNNETILQYYEFYLNDKVKIKQVFKIDDTGNKELISYRTYEKDQIKEKSSKEKALDSLNDELTNDIGPLILEHVNKERNKLNLGKLSFNAKLQDAAIIRAYEQKKAFNHTRPNNKPFSSVFNEVKYSYTKSGENLVMRTQNDYKKKKFSSEDKKAIALAMYNNWYSSKGHRKNMLDKDFNEIGIAIYTETDGTIYGVQLFGKR